jgi:hypothetical protein
MTALSRYVESFANFRCLIGSSVPRGRALYPTWHYTQLLSVNCSLNDDLVLSHELVTSKRACHARLNHHPHYFLRLCLRYHVSFATQPLDKIQIGLGRRAIVVKVGPVDQL